MTTARSGYRYTRIEVPIAAREYEWGAFCQKTGETLMSQDLGAILRAVALRFDHNEGEWRIVKNPS